MTTTNHRSTISLALAATALLAWAPPATAEDCGSPCTVTRAGLPTFRLVNTVSGVDDWDLETSAFGVELALRSDDPNTGAFRVEHGADSNTLVINGDGRVGIGTTVPAVEFQINSVIPQIILDDISPGSGQGRIRMSDNRLTLGSNNGQFVIDTRAGTAVMSITESSKVAIGGFANPQATLHVNGDFRVNSGARIDGDVALGSSRTLKTAFAAVDPAEVLTKLADLPVASWRYKSEEESARHIGPFAEDFQRLFGLGDGETISMVDAQGVALAAIQGLKESLDAKDAELSAVRNRNDELEARLAALSTADGELRNELQELKDALASGQCMSGTR